MNHNPLLPFLVEGRIEAGCDEAGRGCLAGPVYAACVILPADFDVLGINDSKKLTPKKRDELFDVIMEEAVAVGVGIVDHEGMKCRFGGG